MDSLDSKKIGFGVAGALALGSAALYYVKSKAPQSARTKRNTTTDLKGNFAPGERFRKTLEVERQAVIDAGLVAFEHTIHTP